MSFALSSSITIEGRVIGPDAPVFVIAEIGLNHNGDLDLCMETIRSAAACGADCVKFQTFRAEEFMADRDMVYSYQSGGRTARENMYDMFKRLEPPLEWYAEIFAQARALGMVPLTSVADPQSAEAMAKRGLNAFKLSSEDFINLPLMRYVAGMGLPLLLSTGMADEEELADVLELLAASGNNQVAFLHCVSLYPTPDAEANLSRIPALAKATGGLVGYSDHTLGHVAASAAVSLGARLVEKHFTLDKNLPGPDHSFSADPAELGALTQAVRRTTAMLGQGDIAPRGPEREARLAFRRSIVATRDLPAGHLVGHEDLALKRPGSGLRAREAHLVLGRRLINPVKADQILSLTNLTPE